MITWLNGLTHFQWIIVLVVFNIIVVGSVYFIGVKLDQRRERKWNREQAMLEARYRHPAGKDLPESGTHGS